MYRGVMQSDVVRGRYTRYVVSVSASQNHLETYWCLASVSAQMVLASYLGLLPFCLIKKLHAGMLHVTSAFQVKPVCLSH